MSKETVALNMPIPKPVHDKAKADAKAAGVSLKEHIIALIEGGDVAGETAAKSDLIAHLLRPRSNAAFGDETIPEEMYRRIVSMHLMSADRLSQDKGVEAAKQSLARIDELTKDIISQR